MERKGTASARPQNRPTPTCLRDSRFSNLPYSFNEATSTVTGGYFSFMLSIASARMLEIATFRYHLLSDGITNHGACLWLVSAKISS